MLKFLASVFILLSFVSCGVDTSSSSQTAKVEDTTSTNTESDTLTLPPLVDLNPIGDANTTVPDDGTTVPDDGTTVPDDGTTPPSTDVNQTDSDFDVVGAIEDKFACTNGDYSDGYTNNLLKDTSADYLGVSDIEDGVGLYSNYPYMSDDSKTEVTLFYYDLKPQRSMDVESFLEAGYTLSIDTAWAQNDEKVLYVRTPQDINGLFSCYRHDASTIDVDGKITITKVYKLKE